MSESEGRKALEESQKIISVLIKRIEDMKLQASESEKMVGEITRDIKQLDNAKRNLTASIIMVNNLHLLVEGVERLEEASKSRNYNLAASVLEGVQDVLRQFENHRHIPQINDLAIQIDRKSVV